jgi:type IV secretory pathway protease TraF
MPQHSRLTRSLVVAVAAAGFAVSGGTAIAAPSENALQNRSDNAPGGAVTAVDDHRPAGAGEGRKIG